MACPLFGMSAIGRFRVTYEWTIIHPLKQYCFKAIFNGNYVSNNITYKPVIHLAAQTVYTTTYNILEHLH